MTLVMDYGPEVNATENFRWIPEQYRPNTSASFITCGSNTNLNSMLLFYGKTFLKLILISRGIIVTLRMSFCETSMERGRRRDSNSQTGTTFIHEEEHITTEEEMGYNIYSIHIFNLDDDDQWITCPNSRIPYSEYAF